MTDPIPEAHFDAVAKLVRAALMTGDPLCRQRVNGLRLALVRAERKAAPEQRPCLTGQVARLSAEMNAPDAPQTPPRRRRFGADPVKAMVTSGTLWREHEQAASEISEVYEALGRALGAKAGNYDPDASATAGRGRYVQPIERLSGATAAAYEHRYRPWSLWAAGQPGLGTGSLFGLTVDVVVHGIGTAALDRRARIASGRAAILLRRALDEYCYDAGLLARPPRPRDADIIADAHVRAAEAFRRRLAKGAITARSVAVLGLTLGQLKAMTAGDAFAAVRDGLATMGDGIRLTTQADGAKADEPWPAEQRRRHFAEQLFGSAGREVAKHLVREQH